MNRKCENQQKNEENLCDFLVNESIKKEHEKKISRRTRENLNYM
jgi:hypothetical protein